MNARAYAADQLFATLDTTTRQLYLEGGPGAEGSVARPVARSISLSDTVGFIRDLPHKLIEAFEATLQEANDADLLLHVVDCASPVLAEQMAEVQRVLVEIGASKIPQVLVFNKLDRLEATQRPRALRDLLDVGDGRVPRVFVSASSGEGMAGLRDAVREAIDGTLDGTLNPREVTQHEAHSCDEPEPSTSAADDPVQDEPRLETHAPRLHPSLA